MVNAVCKLACVDGLMFLPLQKTVALAGASEWLTLKSKKTFRMGSRVDVGASSNVKAINFRFRETKEMSISETSQKDDVCVGSLCRAAVLEGKFWVAEFGDVFSKNK